MSERQRMMTGCRSLTRIGALAFISLVAAPVRA
jgi:hypothetical protein